MITSATIQLILKIIIPIVILLIAKYLVVEVNPVKESDNTLKLGAYILIMGALLFVEIALIWG